MNDATGASQFESRALAGRRALVTGSAGFIGFHLCRRLLAEGVTVLGVDNFCPYYSVALKEQRNAALESLPGFTLKRADIAERAALEAAWAEAAPDIVVHLAAQAGVRYSVEQPEAYVSANLVGCFNVLEAARAAPPRHLLMASTSSAYGANDHMPFLETDRSAHPLSLYAATKSAGELMGHAYAHLYGLPMTFFRFFTVYGPWGRPDMALFKFVQAITAGAPIEVYNHGAMTRDFTYVDDLVEALMRLIDVVPGASPPVAGDSLSPAAPWRVVNIGQGAPTGLLTFIEEIERALGKTAVRRYLPMQPGDVPATFASADLLERLTGYRPSTPVSTGVAAFVQWWRAWGGAA